MSAYLLDTNILLRLMNPRELEHGVMDDAMVEAAAYCLQKH